MVTTERMPSLNFSVCTLSYRIQLSLLNQPTRPTLGTVVLRQTWAPLCMHVAWRKEFGGKKERKQKCRNMLVTWSNLIMLTIVTKYHPDYFLVSRPSSEDTRPCRRGSSTHPLFEKGLFGLFDPWRWDQYVVSKVQTSVTHWLGTTSQKNGDLNYTTANAVSSFDYTRTASKYNIVTE